MRRLFLASLSVVLAIGCAKAPSPAPTSGDGNTSDVEISIPDASDEGDQSAIEAAAPEKLVSLNVPNMH